MSLLKTACLFLMVAFLFTSCQWKPTTSLREEITPDSSIPIISQNDKETEEALSMDTSMKEPSAEVATFPLGSLLIAVEDNDSVEVVKILASGYKSIDEVNDRGETPLLIAVHNNYIEIAEALILAGADINKQDAIQDSPYLFAGAEGKTEILIYMLEYASPDYSVTNRYGGNALIPAAEKGHIENVRVLLEDGREDINHINNLGYTALLEAVALTDGSETYQEIVRLLLNYGADASIKDNQGLTALDYAERNNYIEIAQIIRSYLS